MNAKDRQLIAQVLRYCNSISSGLQAEVVEWVSTKIADALQAEHPEFDRTAFLRTALLIDPETGR